MLVSSCQGPGILNSAGNVGFMIPQSSGFERLDREVVTQNLRLRPIDVCDERAVANVCAIFLDPATWTHLPAARPQDDIEVKAYLGGHVNSWSDYGLGWWFVSLRQSADDVVVGAGGCALTNPGVQAWNLGYRLSPSVWGHGYATELALAGIAAARAVQADLPITARVHECNPASWRVLDKVGLGLVWRGDSGSDDPLTIGTLRRIYADRDLDSVLLDQLRSLG